MTDQKIFQRLQEFKEKKNQLDLIWTDSQGILEKIEEEPAEVRSAIENQEGDKRIKDELGDLTHAVFCLINFLGFSEADIIDQSLDKLESRVLKIEEQLRTVGLKSLKGLPREEKLRYWQKAKESE